MKRFLIGFVSMLLTIIIWTSTAMASAYGGYVDGGMGNLVYGWAWDPSTPNTPVDVQVTVRRALDGSIVLQQTVTADQYREDLEANQKGNGLHAFCTAIDWSSLSTEEYTIEASAGGTPLIGSLSHSEEGYGTTASDTVTETSLSQSRLTPLGTFKTTAYCPCRACCGKWGKTTSTGTVPRASHTIAVDPRVIPHGSRILINGIVYTAEDEGSGVKGKHIDIFFNTHSEAKNYGLRKVPVYLIN